MGAFGTSMKWLVVVMALTMAQACDLRGVGPALPAGGRWVSFNTVSSEGPLVYGAAILAAPSTAEVEAAVVTFETNGHAGYRLDQACPAPCWRLVRAEEPDRLYLAVATFILRCDTTVKEGVAISGRTLYLIQWVSAAKRIQMRRRSYAAVEAPLGLETRSSRRRDAHPSSAVAIKRLQLQRRREPGRADLET